MNLKIIQNRKIFFIISGTLVLGSILSLAVWGLKLGIDFTGGSLLEIGVPNQNKITAQSLSSKIQEKMPTIGEVRVQPTDKGFLIRMKTLDEKNHQSVLTVLKNENNKIVENRFESIGPIIGNELKVKTIWAIIVALIAIILFVAWSFRKVSKPVASWKYGLGAIVALVHDILIVLGIFSVLGHFFMGFEADVLLVTALLTILGYSVNDTIVVYDRTRENLIYNPQPTFEETVNKSVNETVSRSINTAFTTLLVLFALYFFAGITIKNFVLALIIGIIAGTYSSIFIASPLLVVWQKISAIKRK